MIDIAGLSSLIVTLIMIALLFGFYMLPYLIALARGREDTTAIFVLNLFAGWTFIGYIIALIWAVLPIKE